MVVAVPAAGPVTFDWSCTWAVDVEDGDEGLRTADYVGAGAREEQT